MSTPPLRVELSAEEDRTLQELRDIGGLRPQPGVKPLQPISLSIL
jgi:hypothetical protein